MSWNVIDKPRDSDTHTIADFFEILCLTSIDKEISLDDMEDCLSDYSYNHIMNEDRKYDIAQQIKWRAEAFSNSYAFEQDRNSIKLSTDLSPDKKIYLFLLLSANLPFITKPNQNIYAESFEDLSLLSLINMTGSKAENKRFAKNNNDFIGTKAQRFNNLFNKIGSIGHCDEEHFRNRDSGDGGIDLVSWYKADEYENGNVMSILAQCACSRSEWSKKQSEVSYDSISNLAQNTNRWNSMLFTPICFRDNFGRWFIKSATHNNILFDRLRIINFLNPDDFNNFSFPSNFESMLVYSRDTTE